MTKPLMSKATAVWLVDNTTLTFRQVADFCGMHELEVQGIADGDVATGVKGFDPVKSSNLRGSAATWRSVSGCRRRRISQSTNWR